MLSKLKAALRALPGIQAASAVYPLPLSGMEDSIGFIIEGQPPPASSEWPTAGPRCIGPDYFKALNIQLQRGRVFTESDGNNAPPVVIINEALARQYWQDRFRNRDSICCCWRRSRVSHCCWRAWGFTG